VGLPGAVDSSGVGGVLAVQQDQQLQQQSTDDRWEYDANTGLYFDAQSGYYYNAATGEYSTAKDHGTLNFTNDIT
jgi:hypothetical protein